MTAAGDNPETNPPASSCNTPSAEQAIQIQPHPPAPVVSITSEPAPAPGKGTAPAQLAAEFLRLDQVLVVMTLALAFVLASFPASNSDVWMHLATGRYILHGPNFSFSTDPFSYTTTDTRWINTNWLWDVITYGLAQMGGGPESDLGGGMLVMFKALLVTLLAGVLMLIRRPGHSLWLPAVCVTLALLAMSQRLLFQPTCVSFLFLAVTLFLLQRPPKRTEAERAARSAFRRWLESPQRWYALPMLFLLWVNLDAWFFLGPLTVGLFLLGEFLQTWIQPNNTDGSEMPELKRLGVVLLIGLAACVINPYHVNVFTFRSDLNTFLNSASWLKEERSFDYFFLETLDLKYLNNPPFYQNAAGLAYLLLLGLGALSFVLNYRDWRLSRLLIWLPFMLLGMSWVRAVPFFAVVSVPVIVLNFQDFAARLFGGEASTDRVAQQWSLVGRLGSILAVAALLAFAWPGMLDARYADARSSRRLGWRLTLDPSVKPAVEAINDLHKKGVLGTETHGFNLSQDFANYCAWFCPEEKSFFDYRTQLYSDQTTEDYIKAWQALEVRKSKSAEATASKNEPDPSRYTDWQKVFRDKKIDHVIVFGREWGRTHKAVQLRFWGNPREWTMLYADGRTCIYGWKDPKQTGSPRFQGLRSPLIAKAFGREAANSDTSTDTNTAKKWEMPQKQEFWDLYVHGPTPRSQSLDEATMWYVFYHHDAAYLAGQDQLGQLVDRDIGNRFRAVGSAANGLGPLSTLFYFTYLNRFPIAWPVAGIQRLDIQQIAEYRAVPILALRAAQRLVRENPAEASSYLTLAQALQLLRKDQTIAGSPWLEQVRQVQTITALYQTLQLDPDNIDAHYQIGLAYLEHPTHIDMGLEHMGEALRLLGDDVALRPGETKESRKQRREQVENELKPKIRDLYVIKRQAKQVEGAMPIGNELLDPEKLLKPLRVHYELKALNQSDFTKIRIALGCGLAKRAIQVLDDMDETKFHEIPPGELPQIIQLLVLSGRIDKMQQWISDETFEKLQTMVDDHRFEPVDHYWMLVLVEAARGNYAKMDEYLGEVIHFLRERRLGYAAHWSRIPMNDLASRPLARHGEPPGLMTMKIAAMQKTQECDMWTLRGLLALDQGANRKAVEDFRTALKPVVSMRQMQTYFDLLSASNPLESLCLSTARYYSPNRQFLFDSVRIALLYYQLLEDEARRAQAPSKPATPEEHVQ